jgi:O-antigen/teichoic acid export membrane protein
MSFAELGVGSAMVFSMYKPMAENQTDKICSLLKFYRFCYRLIGLVILMIGLALLPFIDKLIAGNVPDNINIKLLFVIYIVDNIIGYLCFAYKSSLFSASQRVDVISKINITIQVIKNALRIFAVVMLKNYYLYALALPVTTLFNNIIIEYLSRKYFSEYACKGNLEKSEIKVIGSKIGGMFFQKIGSIVLSSADSIVISAFLGLTVLGIYNGYNYIITALNTFLAVIHRSLIPSIGNSIVKESVQKNMKDFKCLNFLYCWLIGWCCICLTCLYQPFIELWQGENNMFSSGIAILFAFYFFIYHMGDMAHIYKEALGLWWEGKFIPLISSLVNLALNLMMIKSLGMYGILLSTIISAMFINVPFCAVVLFKYYFKSVRECISYCMNLLKSLAIISLIALVTHLFCLNITVGGILKIVLISLICIIVPNLIYVLIYFRTETFRFSMQYIKAMFPIVKRSKNASVKN